MSSPWTEHRDKCLKMIGMDQPNVFDREFCVLLYQTKTTASVVPIEGALEIQLRNATHACVIHLEYFLPGGHAEDQIGKLKEKLKEWAKEDKLANL